jgi:hypothetical protein
MSTLGILRRAQAAAEHAAGTRPARTLFGRNTRCGMIGETRRSGYLPTRPALPGLDVPVLLLVVQRLVKMRGLELMMVTLCIGDIAIDHAAILGCGQNNV